jgi:amino-acid N-acetyltransferase
VLLMRVERATEADVSAIEALLTDSDLPLDGAAAAFATGVVARDEDRIVGAAALEPYGEAGLLRSVVVAAEQRGSGVGREVVVAAEALARDLGMRELYLLTETAVEWFPRLGYAPVDRVEVPEAVKASIEFRVLCADTGVAMRRTLPAG